VHIQLLPTNSLTLMFNEEIKRALLVLKEGGTILYPTDTIWGIGCDATNNNAVNKIIQLKGREKNKGLIVLVNTFEMLSSYLQDVPEGAENIAIAKEPTSIIYNNPIGLSEQVVAADGSVAIRITSDPFCAQLIDALEKPIVSTSANISSLQTPASYDQIDQVLLEGVDYVINLRRDENLGNKTSRLLRISSNGN